MKRVITVIVLLAFLAVSVFAAPASAVVTEALLVAGGVMTVGLVASIIICAAAGGGMNSVINEKSAQLGVAPKSFITQKVGEYCQETGMSTPNLLRLFLSGTAISPGNPFDPGSGVATAGNLLLTGSLALWLTGFFSWLWNGESNDDKLEEEAIPQDNYPDEIIVGTIKLKKIVNNTESVLYPGYYYDSRFEPGYNINNQSTKMMFVYGSNRYTYGSYGQSVYYMGRDEANQRIYFHFVGDSAPVCQFRAYNANINYEPTNVNLTSTDNDWSYTFFTGSAKLATFPFLTTDPTSYVFGGGDVSYKENPLVYDPDQLGKPLDRFVVGIGETVKEDTDDPDFPPDVIVGKIPVGDYIEQVAGIYSGTDTNLKVETDEGIVDVPVELTDAGTGVIADAGSIPVVIADEKDVVVADSEQVAEATEDMELDEYTLDLKDFFPFCVPFDIYNMLQLFSDTAEAPNFDWRFYVPGVLDYTLEVDLSDFDPLAEVLRRLELIAFAVALAFATKNIIQGGD